MCCGTPTAGVSTIDYDRWQGYTDCCNRLLFVDD